MKSDAIAGANRLMEICRDLVVMTQGGAGLQKEKIQGLLAEIKMAIANAKEGKPGPMAEIMADMEARLEAMEKALEGAGKLNPVDPLGMAQVFARATGESPPGDRGSIICLECGEKFRSLRVHLRAAHHLSGSEYKRKHGLAPDVPLVCEEVLEIRREAGRRGKK